MIVERITGCERCSGWIWEGGVVVDVRKLFLMFTWSLVKTVVKRSRLEVQWGHIMCSHISWGGDP